MCLSNSSVVSGETVTLFQPGFERQRTLLAKDVPSLNKLNLFSFLSQHEKTNYSFSNQSRDSFRVYSQTWKTCLLIQSFNNKYSISTFTYRHLEKFYFSKAFIGLFIYSFYLHTLIQLEFFFIAALQSTELLCYKCSAIVVK